MGGSTGPAMIISSRQVEKQDSERKLITDDDAVNPKPQSMKP